MFGRDSIMDLSQLKKTRATRVMGVDCSTNSFAFAMFDSQNLASFGEVNFDGSDVFERLHDANVKVNAMAKSGMFDVSFVAIESAILVKNPATAIKLAYIFGSVIGAILQQGTKVVEVAPITWQSYIGNPNLKKAEKEKIKADFPDMSASWYQNKGRSIRKARTLEFANKLHKGEPITSDNVGDAVGIGFYTAHHLTTVGKK
jgi:Holliday junction resolvasome RuvABC endonuclease subunit